MTKEYIFTVLDDSISWGITEICTICHIDTELVFELINEGVLTPEGNSPETWRFDAIAVKRIQITRRLQNDLGVNLPGAALAIDLLEELEELRSILRQIP